MKREFATTIKKLCLAAVLALAAQNVTAQTDTISVTGSDMSGRYKTAVSEGFYKTLDNYAGLESGYHGFVDLGYSFGVGEYLFSRFEASTTHGYQCNPALFVGAGFGLQYMKDYIPEFIIDDYDVWCCRDKNIDVPVFADVRWTMLNNRITPFIDARAGYYVTNGGGVYASATAGCRFYIAGNQAVSVSLGYSYEELRFKSHSSFLSDGSLDIKRSTNNITLKVAYEF